MPALVPEHARTSLDALLLPGLPLGRAPVPQPPREAPDRTPPSPDTTQPPSRSACRAPAQRGHQHPQVPPNPAGGWDLPAAAHRRFSDAQGRLLRNLNQVPAVNRSAKPRCRLSGC